MVDSSGVLPGKGNIFLSDLDKLIDVMFDN